MQKIIYKELDTQKQIHDIVVPKGSTVLNAEGQSQGLFLHVLVPTEHTEEEVVKVHLYMDDDEFDSTNLTYLNTDRAHTMLSEEKAKALFPEQFADHASKNKSMDGFAQMLEGLAEMADDDEKDEVSELMGGLRKKFEDINNMVKEKGHDATVTFHVFIENK